MKEAAATVGSVAVTVADGSRAVAEDPGGSKSREDGRDGGGLRVSEESMLASADDASVSLSGKASDMSAIRRWVRGWLLAMVRNGDHRDGRALIRSAFLCQRVGGGEVGSYPVPDPKKMKNRGAGNYVLKTALKIAQVFSRVRGKSFTNREEIASIFV